MLDIKILGPGCQKCHDLADEVERYVAEHHIDAQVERVTQFFEIARWRVVKTPGLVVNGRVVFDRPRPQRGRTDQLDPGVVPDAGRCVAWLRLTLTAGLRSLARISRAPRRPIRRPHGFPRFRAGVA